MPNDVIAYLDQNVKDNVDIGNEPLFSHGIPINVVWGYNKFDKDEMKEKFSHLYVWVR